VSRKSIYEIGQEVEGRKKAAKTAKALNLLFSFLSLGWSIVILIGGLSFLGALCYCIYLFFGG